MDDIERAARENVLTLGRAWAEGKGIALSSVSRAVHGDPAFFQVLADGKRGGKKVGPHPSFTLRTFASVMRKFEQDWPPDIAWPDLPWTVTATPNVTRPPRKLIGKSR